MGKQINYYMEYESFLTIAQKAFEMGMCALYFAKDDHRILFADNISHITADNRRYWFYLPPVGKPQIKKSKNGSFYFESEHLIIEAGFFNIDHENKKILRNRLYIVTGVYEKDENGEDIWVPRPEAIEKAYNALVRVAKKVAPYTFMTCENIEDMTPEQKKWINKEYISPYCFELWKDEEYRLMPY